MERHSTRVMPFFLITLLLLASAVQAQRIGGGQRLFPRPSYNLPRPPDSILVRFHPGKTPAGARSLARLSAQHTLMSAIQLDREIDKLGILKYRLADPRQLIAVLAQVRQRPEVLYAEPDYHILLLINNPNDKYFSLIDSQAPDVLFPPDQWPYQWPLQFINATAAWSVWPNTYYTAATKPRNAPKVAVIDTGVDKGHPDFINAGGASTDAQNGGQLDLTDSANLFNGGNNPAPTDPTDDFGHGTHVSGIVGAATNNNVGVSALGYPAQVMVIKVTDPSGDGDDADVVQAMVYAADHGALVINLSLAVNGGYSQALQDAVNYCWQKHTLVVAAAGNDGNDFVRRYPAACDKVLAVGATTFATADPNDPTIPPVENVTSYSTQGTYLGIGAPGGDGTMWNNADFSGLAAEVWTQVWSTTPTYPVPITVAGVTTNTYGWLEGTSMASPHVAALAILYAGFKGYTQATAGAPASIVRAIQQGADNIAGRADGGWTIGTGHGRINAQATMLGQMGVGRDAATPGCITGQVDYFGTPVLNAALTAVRNGSTRKYGASSKEDGTFRIANIPSGTYTVTSQYIGLLKTQVVTVLPGCDAMATDFDMDASKVVVTVTPHMVTVLPGATQTFTATVTGASNTGVTWSVATGPGTIDSLGNYTAPTSGTPTSAEVQANSLADPTKFDIAQVTIPTAPVSVTFNRDYVHGGVQVQGTVALSGNAPAGGAVVALSSNNTTVATVPATVTVAAGSTSANFVVSTNPVTAYTVAGISASYGGGTQTGLLSVLQTIPSFFSFVPNPVTGGNTVVAIITMNGFAPAGGLTVALTSDNPDAAQVPATVLVPAGKDHVMFNITTSVVPFKTSSLISGTVNGATARKLLVVTP